VRNSHAAWSQDSYLFHARKLIQLWSNSLARSLANSCLAFSLSTSPFFTIIIIVNDTNNLGTTCDHTNDHANIVDKHNTLALIMTAFTC
jgi:hypothetical protein